MIEDPLPKPQRRIRQSLPTEEDSLNLLYKFQAAIGDVYHFIDQRQSADHLTTFFHSTSPTKSNDTWYIELLLILALGQLFSARRETETPPPGTAYFLEARDRLPDVQQLLLEPVLGIEIMCLLAVYLWICDKGDDAYIYVCHSFTNRSQSRCLLDGITRWALGYG